ncbi:MAG: hypothetical protein COU27_02505 [Candidatus Levybacteria bacterium CG10_big_fil_rev_8_21_14_0_10_36_7]|nr:MAG: hypothetical protein COU27_02505 [Candidatus Levybacteria bacterium CG10_big_fil_rev_8_21_14_0_10_36_7]
MLKKEFRYSFKNGVPKNIINSFLFTLRYQRNNLLKNTFAVVTSKKIDKRATVRNRLKRKFLGEIEKKKDEIKKPYNYVFFLKKNALNCENEFETEIQKAILQIN